MPGGRSKRRFSSKCVTAKAQGGWRTSYLSSGFREKQQVTPHIASHASYLPSNLPTLPRFRPSSRRPKVYPYTSSKISSLRILNILVTQKKLGDGGQMSARRPPKRKSHQDVTCRTHTREVNGKSWSRVPTASKASWIMRNSSLPTTTQRCLEAPSKSSMEA